jgi:hypothetical protein
MDFILDGDVTMPELPAVLRLIEFNDDQGRTYRIVTKFVKLQRLIETDRCNQPQANLHYFLGSSDKHMGISS